MVAARRFCHASDPPSLSASIPSPVSLCSLLNGSVENNKIMQIIQLLYTRKAKYNYAHTAVSVCVRECASVCVCVLARARWQQRQFAKIISA